MAGCLGAHASQGGENARRPCPEADHHPGTTMGDELHNRHSAASSLFANGIWDELADIVLPKTNCFQLCITCTNHNLIFLGLAMAAEKRSQILCMVFLSLRS